MLYNASMHPEISPARFSQAILTCPKPGIMAVLVTLKNFVIVTFDVAPEALALHLPPGFEPEVRTLANGRKRAFISAVTFLDVDFRLSACQWPRDSFGQTNYRSYVIYQGERVGWFFGTSLATPFVQIPRHLWQLPWHQAKMTFDVAWDADRKVCTRYYEKTTGEWGNAEIELTSSGESAATLDGFYDDEDTAVMLTHPLVAYYYRRDGKLGTYGIWHDKLKLQRATATKAEFEVFNNLNLTKPGQTPHSVLLQDSTDFTILLPPRLVSTS